MKPVKPGERQILPRCHICAKRISGNEALPLCFRCATYARTVGTFARRLLNRKIGDEEAFCLAEGLLRCLGTLPLPELKHVVLVRERLEAEDGERHADAG